MNYKSLFVIFFFFITGEFIAQETGTHDGDENNHGHSHHRNEIGIANAPVFFVRENEFSYGLHFHYIRSLQESKFGVGVGFERIFDKHGHNTFGLIGSFRPIDPLSFILSPGITFEDENSNELNFALHAEAAYEFELNDFHIGPVIEFAYDPEDFHISLGIHIGIGF